MTPRRVFGLLFSALLAPSGATGEARAETPLSVKTDGCSLDLPALDRLIQIELGSVLQRPHGARPFRVDLACKEGDLSISIFDAITRKNISRTVNQPAPTSEPERLVALAVAQLYRASWLELLAEDPPPLPPPPREVIAAPEAVQAARLTVDRLVAPEAPPGLSLVAAGGARWHARAPAALGAAAIGAAVPARGLLLGVEVGLLKGTASRDAGAVGLWLIEATATVQRELWASLRARVVAGPELSAAYQQLGGRPSRAAIAGGTVSGAGVDAGLRASVWLRLGPVGLGAQARGGYLLGVPRGFIAGSDPVSLGGPWVGAELRLSWP